MDFVKSLQRDKISQMVKDLGVDIDVDVTPAKVVFMTLLRSTGREGIGKLLSYLEKSDFFEAPASTKFHGNYEGALCVHSLGVAALLLEKNKSLDLGLTTSNCLIAGLLHDLCKTNFYTTTSRNMKINGRWESVNSYLVDDQFPLGHGEKSAMMAMQYISLKKPELMMIRWHMGPFSGANDYDFNNAVNFMPEIMAMYTADSETTALMEITLKPEEGIKLPPEKII